MKKLQVKDIIPFLNQLDHVKVYQGDVYTNPDEAEDPWENIFTGSVMDMPWYILNFYLCNTIDGEAIGIETNENDANPNHRVALSVSVVENKESLEKCYKI